jgi:transposase-like protein
MQHDQILNYNEVKNLPAQKKQFQIRVVREIESGEITFTGAVSKYQISSRTIIYNWVKKFGDPNNKKFRKLSDAEKRLLITRLDNGKLNENELFSEYNISPKTLESWRKEFSGDLASNIEASMQQTDFEPQERKLIEHLKLQVSALETMIDLAENEFNIDIRKKSGSKQ